MCTRATYDAIEFPALDSSLIFYPWSFMRGAVSESKYGELSRFFLHVINAPPWANKAKLNRDSFSFGCYIIG